LRGWLGRRRNRLVLWLAVAAGCVWYVRRPLFEENFAAVEAGRVYRSAQPSATLPGWIARYGLRSILNLRGGSPRDAWYRDEVAAAERGQLEYYDLPMDAGSRPERGQLLAILDVFERCPYPILIHCKKGADRTGLATALYLMTQRGLGPEEALAAFTLEHLHVPMCGPEKLHEPLREYAAWLKARGVGHTAERFRGWVEREYRAADGLEAYRAPRPGSRFALREAGDRH
jgi:protein tyrosine phosphatase (PTP) superfamily phosphohydrolase (DUF442 family)